MNWTINGRFLTQRTTGVQRYAREICAAIDERDGDLSFELLTPSAAEQLPVSKRIHQREAGVGQGHAWEQFSLPFKVDYGLISLCNTGPILGGSNVVCIHDANVWTYPSSYSAHFRAIYRALLPILGRKSSKILTVSKASADSLVANKIAPSSKIEVIPNGYEHILKWDARRASLSMADIDARRPFVFALGSKAPHKNLGLLMQIAPMLDECGLDLYVSGGSSGIFAQDEKLAPPRNVRMLGFVSDHDLALLYQKAHCLAFPSFVEGFGLPLVEAMGFGCPIVSSNTSCMPEIAGDYASYAAPDEPSAWVKAIVEIDRNVDYSRAGAEQLAGYSWAASAARLEQILEGAM